MNNCIKMQFSLMQCGLTIIVVFFSIFSSHKKKKKEKIKHLHNIQSGQVFVLLQYIFPDTYMPAIIHAHNSCIHIYIYTHTNIHTCKHTDTPFAKFLRTFSSSPLWRRNSGGSYSPTAMRMLRPILWWAMSLTKFAGLNLHASSLQTINGGFETCLKPTLCFSDLMNEIS